MKIHEKHIQEVRSRHPRIPERIIMKDIVLSYILQELSTIDELIFKGGTCLSKCYLEYHRFSEDLDFNVSFPDNKSKTKHKRQIRDFFKSNFLLKLQNIADKYGLDFDKEEFSTDGVRYCPVKSGDNIFIFNIYHMQEPIKIEINVSEKIFFETANRKIVNFNQESKYLTYPLKETYIRCYKLEEIALEKIRALLTRPDGISERDIFDLFLINEKMDIFSLSKADIRSKLESSIFEMNEERFKMIYNYGLFEEIDNLALIEYDKNKYMQFFENLKMFTKDLKEEL